MSSAQWANANVQTAWEPERPIGGFEMNSIDTKYIKQCGLIGSKLVEIEL